MRKRNHAVYTRFNDAEYMELMSRVNQSGQTIQSYMINASLKSTIMTKEAMDELKGLSKTFEDYDKQLRGIGINLNQMAHIANGRGDLPLENRMLSFAEEIKKLRKEVNENWQLTRQLIARQNHMAG